jgi:hypothetical protein
LKLYNLTLLAKLDSPLIVPVFVKVLAQVWVLRWRLAQSVALLGTLLKKHWRWLILLLRQNCKRLESSLNKNSLYPQWSVKSLVAHCHRFRV